jgi:hypothetical protein
MARPDEREQPNRHEVPEHEPSPADPDRQGPKKEWAPGRRQQETSEEPRPNPDGADVPVAGSE